MKAMASQCPSEDDRFHPFLVFDHEPMAHNVIKRFSAHKKRENAETKIASAEAYDLVSWRFLLTGQHSSLS